MKKLKYFFYCIYRKISPMWRKYDSMASDYWRDIMPKEKKEIYQKALFAKTRRERRNLIKQL